LAEYRAACVWLSRASSTCCNGAIAAVRTRVQYSAARSPSSSTSVSGVLLFEPPGGLPFRAGVSARRTQEVERMKDAAVAEVQTSLRGIVEIVFYSGATFSAGKLPHSGRRSCTFAGKIFVREGESVRLEGHWAKHPK